MEPQGTPTPSEQPNQMPQSTPPAAQPQPTPGPVTEPLGQQPVTGAQPVAQPTTEAWQPTVQPFASPLQPNAQAVSGVPQPTSQPFVGASAAALPPAGSKKRWMLPVAVLVALALLGGGYAFAFYLPNRPSAVYSTSLKRTGEAVDTLVSYSNTQAQKHYKSYGVDGKLTITADGTSFDASVSGSVDTQENATATVKADIMGVHATADVRSIHVAGSTSPDLYLRATGIKTALDGAGASSLDGLDGQWLSLDHTLLNSYATSYSSAASMAATTSLPTDAQAHDALVKMQTVNKQYLFTTDATHAVLQNKKYIGKETKDGHSVYHYAVGYSKAHLKSYIDALSGTLDGSSLNTWSKKANDGQNLSEALEINSLKSAIDGAKADYSFDVWVDAKTKLIQSVQFSDPSKPGTTFSFAQNYTSGSSYPFSFSYQGKDNDGTAQSANLKLTVDTTSNKETGVVAINTASAKIDLNLTVTPSTSGVQVTAPTDAQSVSDLLSGLGLGSF